VRRFGEIDSTNRWLLDEARRGAPEGVVAVADHQTAGRGRLGRTWEAPSGASLLMSVLLRPTVDADRFHLLTAAVGLAALDAVGDVPGMTGAGLKWPNDLVVDDLKLGGILAEVVPPRTVVVGLGLNLDWPPDRLLATATAVNVVAGRAPARDDVLTALLDALTRWYGDLDGVPRAYRARCVTIGRLVRVELVDEVFTGRALDVDDDGHLLVDVGACVRTVTAGDVVHLRNPT
jgi:BirA family biotin operon repressor/biotin-[acetyl-CoA-carboxylase] ligase